MDKETIAYAAGLFDGEGSIHLVGYITKYGHRNTIAIEVANTKPELCQFFKDHWGGSIVSDASNKGYKVVYRWQLYGKKAYPFLKDIQPYSIGREKLIKLAIEFIETLGCIRGKPLLALGRASIAQEITHINHRLI